MTTFKEELFNEIIYLRLTIGGLVENILEAVLTKVYMSNFKLTNWYGERYYSKVIK